MDAKMRATLRGQVKGCSLKHNSHEHKGDEKNIIYYSALTNSRTKNPTSKQMIEDELAFYEKYFDGRLKMSNKKYIENFHKERCQTLKQFYDKHQPEELILQIGDKNKQGDFTKEQYAIEQEQDEKEAEQIKKSWELFFKRGELMELEEALEDKQQALEDKQQALEDKQKVLEEEYKLKKQALEDEYRRKEEKLVKSIDERVETAIIEKKGH